MTHEIELLVLGLGNPLLSDEGVGPAAIEMLARRYAPGEGVELVDGGTLGLALVPFFSTARRAILVDAILADAPPGTIVRLDAARIPRARGHRLSPHDLGIADVIAAVRCLDAQPEEIVVVGVVPETMGVGTRRSPAVERVLPRLVEEVAREAERLGYPFRPRGDAVAAVVATSAPAAPK